MTITTGEAGEILGTSEANVRQLVKRGHLAPNLRGARPLRLDEDAVLDLHHERRTPRELARIRRLAADFLAR